MPLSRPTRHSGAILLLIGLLVMVPLFGAPAPASAAGPPILGPTWAGEVTSGSARLHGAITPNGLATSYHFDYITNAGYEANVAASKEGFAGAAKVPPGADAVVGSGTSVVSVVQSLSALAPETSYRYRLVAKNSAGTVPSETLTIATQGFASGSILLDNRAWEMVSPVQKNGGQVDAPGTLAGGGVFQAAAGGNAVTYGSATSFGSGAQGAPQGSQYVATRSPAGWANQNITTPMLSGSYGSGPVGVPYQLFSEDLSTALLLNGRHCRGGGAGCPVANAPLPGSGAPAGYENYYLRQAGGFAALLDSADLAHSALDAAHFDLDLAGASPGLGHVVLSSCAALTASATEVPAGEGCDPLATNLYEWSGGTLSLLNSASGAALAASSGAISADGSRVYFTQGGNLYLREGSVTKQADLDAGGGGSFATASADGAVSYFTRAEHLWRYEAGADSATDLTPAGEVKGVLGASADGSYLYYLAASGLFARHGATTTEIAPTADAGNYPPATGTARVSADGTRLAFMLTAPQPGFDNTDQISGEPDSQVYRYDALADRLTCVSCNPTYGRPVGPSWLAGSYPNGTAPGSLNSYKPRAMSADGNRLFFDSADALVLADTNGEPDAYEWEAQGTGSCTKTGGCLALVSSGKASSPSSFVDASADGSDVYFLTERSLVEPTDPGSVDLYDARVNGGLPLPLVPIPCAGDACQSLPSEPEDPAVTTLVSGPGNPAVRYPKHGKRHKKAKGKKHRQKPKKQKSKRSRR
jgi:hypothetical protein